MRRFLATELEGVATYWTIKRRDGVTLGFTSHNRDLRIDGIPHRAAPGMVPSAIRRSARLERDAVEVDGVLSHDLITAEDLQNGRYENARVAIGVVDWETREHASLFHGDLAGVTVGKGEFQAELRSSKARLDIDVVPRTSPTCRAGFCDDACQLNPAAYTHLANVVTCDLDTNSVDFAFGTASQHFQHGTAKWIDGPHAGVTMEIMDVVDGAMVFDSPLSTAPLPGTLAMLREGCDHTLATCHSRFGNARNFRGEPHLPGNDLLTRTASAPG